jgi:hypothetical protein
MSLTRLPRNITKKPSKTLLCKHFKGALVTAPLFYCADQNLLYYLGNTDGVMFMKKTLLLIPAFALSLASCGYSVVDAVKDIKEESKSELADGTLITTEPVTTQAFTKLAAIGPDTIVFVTGDSFKISASGDAETLKHLRYKIKDGQIIIGRDKSNWYGMNNRGATVTVTAPILSAISLAGSGDMTADKMTGDTVSVEVAGSGNLSVEQITGTALESSIAGSGDVDIGGKVTTAEYSVAGSGNINALKLSTTDAEVSIAGSGDVSLSATGTVNANTAGSGDINVKGGAKCESSSVGSGSINCS